MLHMAKWNANALLQGKWNDRDDYTVEKDVNEDRIGDDENGV